MSILRKPIRMARITVEHIPFGKYAIRAGYRYLHRKQQKLANNSLQLYGKSIYAEIHGILSNHGVRYWADFGTLLGVIRDHGPIAHDDDIDFSIDSANDFKQVHSLLISNGYSLSHGWTLNGTLTEIAFIKHNINIDFFLNIPKEGGLATYLYLPRHDFIGEKLLSIDIRERIRPFVHEIEAIAINNDSTFVSVPKNYIEILESTYGSWEKPDNKFDCAKCTATCVSRMISGNAAYLPSEELLRSHLT